MEMSNVASLENCKRLYELSGWVNGRSIWSLSASGHKAVTTTKRHFDTDRKLPAYPAYSAGYLLRKLPERHHLAHKVETITGTPYYEASLREIVGTKGARIVALGRADTPEDALALLAIKLFKQGILKKG